MAPHRIEERVEPMRVVEAAGRIGQAPALVDPGAQLDLPHDPQCVTERIVLDRR